MTTNNDIHIVKELIQNVVNCLRDNDSDIIELPDDCEIIEYDEKQKQIERKLHEVCINHRVAVYLEDYVKLNINADYKVDIEYNRYYKNKKVVRINETVKSVRPDIIVHSRTNRNVVPQHYLIIEAKKNESTPEDENKIRAFIQDKKYEYMFGLTVSYKDLNTCTAKLFYKWDDEVVFENLKF